jgi:hypothetical protein
VIALYLRSLERVSIPANSAQTSPLLRLEEQDGAVTKVEVDEVLGLCMIVSMFTAKPTHLSPRHLLTVGDEAAKVPANNAMPCCALPLVELQDVSIRCKLLGMLRRTVRLMWWAISCEFVSPYHPCVVCVFAYRDTNLLDCVLLHGFLGCWCISIRSQG